MTTPKRLSPEELEQARLVVLKPWRFESTHPSKWSDLTDRLLSHIAAQEAELAEARAQEREACTEDKDGK